MGTTELEQIRRLEAAIAELNRNQRLLLKRVTELSNSSATLLADGRVITNLRTGQRMFIDSRDTGSGFNIITSGHIEPNVMKFLQKTFEPGSVFLDVGTNFGFYTVMAGAQLGPSGRIFSFEANPFLVDFIKKNAYTNGLSRIVTVINKAVSDRDGTAQFGFSFSGIGGGSLSRGANKSNAEDNLIEVPLVRIDDALPSDVVVDCVKLDVEGAELAALRGMSGVVARSPNIKIVMEFFPPLLSGSGGAELVLDVLEEMGLGYWRINERGHLDDVPKHQLATGGDCYIVASRVRPDDRTLVLGQKALRFPGIADAEGWLGGAPGAVLVHGPYWYLPRGVYDIVVEGQIQGSVDASIAHEFGHVLAAKTLDEHNLSFAVALQEDVRYFEVVLRSTGPTTKVKVERVLVRERV